MKKLIIIGLLALSSGLALAANETSCEHGGACPGSVGGNGSGGAGGNGGNGGAGGNGGSSIAASGSTSTATTGNASASVSGTGGAATNSVTTGNVRALSLGASAVGSPAADTCVAYFAVGFGLVTSPVQIESCVAMQQALLLEHFGLRDAAIARLCQLKEIDATGICPQKAAKAE